MEDWMTNLPWDARARPITQLAIPGSHDSGTVDLDTSLGIVEGYSSIYKLGKSITHNWAKTQDLSIADQLKAGIRYFDLRVAGRPGTDELYIVHTLYGRRVSDVLEDVKIFLESHPKEVVILDFNHFNMIDKTHKRHISLLDSLREKFGRMCTPRPTENNMWTLNDLRIMRHQMITFYDYNAIPQNHVDTVWPSNRIISPWANTDNLEKLKRFHNEIYNIRKNCNHSYQFYVWQWVLTPVFLTIVPHFWSTLKSQLSLQTTKACVDWLDKKENITICIVDFVEDGFIQEVVGKNIVWRKPLPLTRRRNSI